MRASTARVDLKGVTGRVAIRPVNRAASGLSLVKLRLPRDTPPGTYEGTVEVGGVEVPIVAQVEPRARLRFMPASLMIKAAPGAMIDADLTLVNSGNVAVTLEPKYTFCIYDGTGIERAFFVALTDEQAKGGQRLDKLMDELADSHGGLVRLIVERGAGEVAPGEARDLHVALRFSDHLRPDRIYGGGWTVATTNFYVQIEVIAKQPASKRDYEKEKR
jgi:hypothetical protein